MMRSIKRFAGLYLLLDLVLMAGMYAAGGALWLLNAQVAFIASLLVTLASFHAYRKMVTERAHEEADGLFEERDHLDRIDDPHALFEEEESRSEPPQDVKALVREERAKLRDLKTTARHLAGSAKGLFSLWRLGSYLVLVLAFLFLNRQGWLVVVPFLVGLAVVPAGAFLAGFLRDHRSA